MKSTAVLLDLGFVLRKLYDLFGKRPASAQEVHAFARQCLRASEEELFRIYCYHCPPYGETQTHPLTKKAVNFASTRTFRALNTLLRELMLMNSVAYRAGELSFDGWKVTRKAARDILKTGRALQPADFAPELNQKGVDIKIGLDVAWLASKSIVERIVLVTADSDFVPAMKFARREGVQVVLVTMGHSHIKHDFKVHADEVRSIAFP